MTLQCIVGVRWNFPIVGAIAAYFFIFTFNIRMVLSKAARHTVGLEPLQQ